VLSISPKRSLVKSLKKAHLKGEILVVNKIHLEKPLMKKKL
jgi:hypothetical protein